MRNSNNRLNNQMTNLEERSYLSATLPDQATIDTATTEQIAEVGERSVTTQKESARAFQSDTGAGPIVDGTENTVYIPRDANTTNTVHSHPTTQSDLSNKFETTKTESAGVTSGPSAPDLTITSDYGISEAVVSGNQVYVAVPSAEGVQNTRSSYAGATTKGEADQETENTQARITARQEQDARNAITAIQSRDGNRPDQQADAGTSDSVSADRFTKSEFQEVVDAAVTGSAEVVGITIYKGEVGNNPDGSTTTTKLKSNSVSSDTPQSGTGASGTGTSTATTSTNAVSTGNGTAP